MQEEGKKKETANNVFRNSCYTFSFLNLYMFMIIHKFHVEKEEQTRACIIFVTIQ